jgi:hypothetical protein
MAALVNSPVISTLKTTSVTEVALFGGTIAIALIFIITYITVATTLSKQIPENHHQRHCHHRRDEIPNVTSGRRPSYLYPLPPPDRTLPRPSPVSITIRPSKEGEEDECSICLDAKSTISFAPCGHRSLCDKCEIKYNDTKYPICRQEYTHRIKMITHASN